MPQKFSLTIDLQYEDPTIAIAPELTAEVGRRRARGRVRVRPAGAGPALRRAGARSRAGARRQSPGDALDLARDYIGEGLLDLALGGAEPGRRPRRAARRHRGPARRHLRQARALRRGPRALPRRPRGRARTIPTPRWARSARCSRSAGPATPRRWPTSWRAGCAATSRCWSRARGCGWRSATRSARSTASARPRRSRPGGPTSSICRPRSPPGSATAPPRSRRSTPRSSSIRPWCGSGTSSAAWRRSGATGPRRARPTSARSTCCPPTAPRRSRWPTCSGAPSRRARRSSCSSACSRPTPTSSRRSRRWAARCSRTAAPRRRSRRSSGCCASIPEHAGALYHQGAALARQRQFDQAVQAWERVVQLDPAGPYAAQARSRARSARDLQHIFAASAG